MQNQVEPGRLPVLEMELGVGGDQGG